MKDDAMIQMNTIISAIRRCRCIAHIADVSAISGPPYPNEKVHLLHRIPMGIAHTISRTTSTPFNLI
jgi:hypothetical protein